MTVVVAIAPVTRDQALRLGRELGVDFRAVSIDEFTAGVNVELEHIATIQALFPRADSEAVLRGAAMIALDHLTEIPDYYVRLRKMEREAIGK